MSVQVESTLAPETAASQQCRGSDAARTSGDIDPGPLPPPPTVSVVQEDRKRSTESRNAAAATASSSVRSCNDEFLLPKVVSELPTHQCNKKEMRL